MKIGILTFHRAHNYGAVLQCYALMQYLASLGHDVYIVDYKNENLLRCYKWFDKRRFLHFNLYKLGLEILLLYRRNKRFRNFEKFVSKYYKLISPDSKAIAKLDYVIVGSDQVWNTKLTKGFDPWYWGKMFLPLNVKIISYAASMEQYWGKENDETVASLLKTFSAISVREDSLQQLLNGMTRNSISVTVDPTLLLSKEAWGKFAIKPKIEEPYLLLYQVRNTSQAYEYAKFVSKKYALRLVCLSARVDNLNSNKVATSSPNEFVGLFKYASIVIACSFHGVVFSVIFKKKFIALELGDGRDSRYSDFLGKLGLNQALRKIDNIKETIEDIDYEKADDKLQEIVCKSKNWLKDNIQ